MKTSIDLPDDLYSRMKAKCAMERRTVREVATTLLAGWVNEEVEKRTMIDPPSNAEWLYRWNALGRRVAEVETHADPRSDGEGLVEDLRVNRR